MDGSSLAPLPVVLPLSAAAFLAGLNEVMPRRWADALSIAAAGAAGALCAWLCLLSRQGTLVYWFGGWLPRSGVALGISFAIDPVGAGLAAFACLLVVSALVFSLRYFDTVGTLYHVLMLVFLAGMCGFCLTGDMFDLFVFFELMSVAAFALCGYKIEEPESMEGTLNFGVTNTIGAFLALCGLALLYGRTGALNMAQIGAALGARADGLVSTALAFIMAGFFIKAAVVPFHFWLDDAHAVAPTPVCVLFSGIMVQLGLYGVVRVYWAVFSGVFAPHSDGLRTTLLALGAATALLGGILCFRERSLKRLLAFSTISHSGTLLGGFALLRPQALGGAVAYILGHGLSKGALFMAAGVLLHRFGTVDEDELRGRGRDMRLLSAVFFVGGLGLATTVPFLTFHGQAAIEECAEGLGAGWFVPVLMACCVLTAGAVFRVWAGVFLGWGEAGGGHAGSKKIEEGRETKGRGRPVEMKLAAAALALGSLALGCLPGLGRGAETAAAQLQDRPAYQSRVLEDALEGSRAALWQAPERATEEGSVARSLLTLALAWGLAALALRPGWPLRRPLTRGLGVVLRPLHELHSGHVGDYIAFLTLGAAGLAVVLGALCR